MDGGLDFSGYIYWISIRALILFILLINIGFATGLSVKKRKCFIVVLFCFHVPLSDIFLKKAYDYKFGNIVSFLKHKVLMITFKFSAPGTSRSIISCDDIAKLRGRDQLMSMDANDGMRMPKVEASLSQNKTG
jgi:hypothetical protein